MTNTLIQPIHHVAAPIKNVDMALMRTTVPQWSEPSGVKVDRCVCVLFITPPIHRFTLSKAHCCTDEWLGYNHIIRAHATVNHGQYEWARDDDGDRIREVHINTCEGMWTDVRTFLRTFKGVHKRFLSGYIAVAEFRRNLKRISPAFIASLVILHTFNT